MKALINKILDTSFVDGDGNRTVIFFQGCNLNCMYCHNPETICSKDFDKTVKLMTVDEVFEIVRVNRDFIRGITCSGGECTMWNAFVTELFKKVQQLGLTCLADTNGAYIDLEEYPELVKYTDGFMLDIKATDDDIHQKLTGRSSTLVLKNANYLAKIGKLKEIRTVVTQEVLDNEQTIRDIGALLKPYNTIIDYKLIKFRHYGVRDEYSSLGTPSDDEMNRLEDCALEYNFNIKIT